MGCDHCNVIQVKKRDGTRLTVTRCAQPGVPQFTQECHGGTMSCVSLLGGGSGAFYARSDTTIVHLGRGGDRMDDSRTP